jgi:hypothetical protein
MSFLNLHNDSSPRRVLYLGAILLIGVPIIQAGSQLWPLQLGNIQWRFGAANALSSVLLLPFLGFSMLFLLSRALESKTLSRMVGGGSSLLALGLLGSLVLFISDAGELRAIVNSQMLATFTATTLRVGSVATLFLIAFAVLAQAGFSEPARTLARGRRVEKKSEQQADKGVGLIVGQ